MPNWVYNRVHGNKKVTDLLVGPKGNVTFQKLLPEPEALKGLSNFEYDNASEIQALIDLVFHKKNFKMKELLLYPRFKGYTLDELSEHLLSKYPYVQLQVCNNLLEETGYFDWYSWRCTYWGCKWDADSDEGAYKGDEEEIEFETPWAPPKGVMDEIAAKYPDLKFTWHCDEESCAFSIDYIFNGDGTITEVDVPPEYYTPYIPDEDELEEDEDAN
jgi:hypothetical protein